MIISITSNALAIGQVASSQYNGLLFDYDKIIDRNASQERNIFTLASLSYSIKSNLKLWLFCGNLTGNLLNGNQIKRMVRSEVRTENATKTEQANLYRNSKAFTKAIKVLVKSDNYLSSVFANFSRQALITQAEKLLLSFLTFASICPISSWGKRIFFNCDLLFLLPVTIIQSLTLTFKLSKFIDNSKNLLTCLHTRLYIGIYTPNKYFRSYKTIAQRVCTSMDYLTTNIKDANAMANSNNTLHPKNGQHSKQFKFYNPVTSNIISVIATNEAQARDKISPCCVFIFRQPLAMGACHV